MVHSHTLLRRSLFAVPLESRCVPDATLQGTDTVKLIDTPSPESEVTVQTLSAVVPAIPAKRFAVGAAAGANGLVNVYDAATNNIISTVTPFGTSYTGGVRVATADLNGDGIDLSLIHI